MTNHAHTTTPPTRRNILRVAATLPLVGAATIAGINPTRPAEPITQELLESYNAWLHYERRLLAYEMYPGVKSPDRWVPEDNPGASWHWRELDWRQFPQPSTRAALVLGAVGCDWRSEA